MDLLAYLTTLPVHFQHVSRPIFVISHAGRVLKVGMVVVSGYKKRKIEEKQNQRCTGPSFGAVLRATVVELILMDSKKL